MKLLRVFRSMWWCTDVVSSVLDRWIRFWEFRSRILCQRSAHKWTNEKMCDVEQIHHTHVNVVRRFTFDKMKRSSRRVARNVFISFCDSRRQTTCTHVSVEVTLWTRCVKWNERLSRTLYSMSWFQNQLNWDLKRFFFVRFVKCRNRRLCAGPNGTYGVAVYQITSTNLHRLDFMRDEIVKRQGKCQNKRIWLKFTAVSWSL